MLCLVVLKGWRLRLGLVPILNFHGFSLFPTGSCFFSIFWLFPMVHSHDFMSPIQPHDFMSSILIKLFDGSSGFRGCS